MNQRHAAHQKTTNPFAARQAKARKKMGEPVALNLKMDQPAAINNHGHEEKSDLRHDWHFSCKRVPGVWSFTRRQTIRGPLPDLRDRLLRRWSGGL
jgi:hypothetical protein